MKKALILALLIPLVVGPSLPVAGQDNADTIKKILTARSLWGKDFAAGMAFLPAWSGGEERTVAIFQQRIVAATPFETAEAAQQKRDAVARALTAPRPQSAPGFEDLLQPFAAERAAPFETAVVRSEDDDTFRVALTGPQLEFLPENLTIQQVQEVAGQPESVTTQLIQGEGERRPVTLTLRSYANGAIVYAESDWAPRPGLVDRVILSVPDVTAVLFRGGQ